MISRTTLLFSGTTLLLALSCPASALEDLEEEHMSAVALEGLEPLITQVETTIRAMPQARLQPATLSHHLPWADVATEENIERSVTASPPLVSQELVRTNNGAKHKYADIDILMDRSKDQSSSSNDGGAFRLELSTQIDSAAIINARHRAEDVASRGSYYVNQMEVNSTVIIHRK